MYYHEIENQINALNAVGLILDEDMEKARAVLKKAWENKIAVVWLTEDVIGRAKEIGIDITEERAAEVLHMAFDKHDATMGITWETFDYYIEYGDK